MLYNIDANNIDKMWDRKALGFPTYNIYTLYLLQPNNMLFTYRNLCIKYFSNY